MTTTGTSDLVELPPGYYIDPGHFRDDRVSTGAWCSLPWPTEQAEKDALLAASLGPRIIRWAEWRDYEETGEPGLVHHLTGEPWRFTKGQKRFFILWYAFDSVTGRWKYRSGVKRGAKGTGKDPFGACWCDIELIGPSHLVKRDGQWVGERHRMPLVQIASNSEAQSKDVLRVANAMLCAETREYYNLDPGETRTIIKGEGGRLEILTASERSSEGDPATAIMVNESHHMTESSGGHRVAAVARRNVGKSPRELQARVCEFTNAHMVGMDSVAEQSYNAWQAQVSGRNPGQREDILYDSIEAPPDIRLHIEESRLAGLTAAYADAPWADLERLSGEMVDLRTSEADSIRYYLNGLATAEDAWIDPRKFDELARPDIVVGTKEQITMFLDCSKSEDSTGLVGCRLKDGHVFKLGLWQKPHGHRGKGWLAPREEVDAAVRAAFQQFSVVWFGVDPSPARDDEDESLYWMQLADRWHRDFRKKLPVWATPGEVIGHSVLFDMRLSQRGAHERMRVFTEQAMQCAKDIDEDAALTWDGDPGIRLHAQQARRRPNQWGVSLGKVTRDSNKLVDLAVCMVGARMGRRIALNSGKVKQRSNRVVAF